MRKTTVAIAALVLLSGCGKGSSTHTAPTSTQPARSSPPKYVPGGHHPHRPPGSVYSNEIGENIVTAPRDRIIKLFGPPASKHGNCIRYRIVKQRNQQWEFCFKGQTMTSAAAVPA